MCSKCCLNRVTLNSTRPPKDEMVVLASLFLVERTGACFHNSCRKGSECSWKEFEQGPHGRFIEQGFNRRIYKYGQTGSVDNYQDRFLKT